MGLATTLTPVPEAWIMAFLHKRGPLYYLHDRIGGRLVRTSLKTDSLQLAKEKLRQYESAKLHDTDSPLPTRTPIADVLTAYVQHIRATKTAKSAQTDVYYLREMFGPCCEAVKINSRTPSDKARKRPRKDEGDKRKRDSIIEADCFEGIRTSQIVTFIGEQVRRRGLRPKTANRYREILVRLFNWAMKQKLVRMPGGVNPAAAVERYREHAPEIRFLTLAQIDEQLTALAELTQLRAMAAVLIYAGLRREELLWLTEADVDLDHGRSGGLIRVQAKTVGGRSWEPKTKVNRAVPISRDLYVRLKDYKPMSSPEGWYFPSPKGRWWDPDNFAADLRKANRAAGLDWGCLDFRHTFGSQLAQNGISLYKIATLMGNSPEICRRHYAALVPEAMVEEVQFRRLQKDADEPQPTQSEAA